MQLKIELFTLGFFGLETLVMLTIVIYNFFRLLLTRSRKLYLALVGLAFRGSLTVSRFTRSLSFARSSGRLRRRSTPLRRRIYLFYLRKLSLYLKVYTSNNHNNLHYNCYFASIFCFLQHPTNLALLYLFPFFSNLPHYLCNTSHFYHRNLF